MPASSAWRNATNKIGRLVETYVEIIGGAFGRF